MQASAVANANKSPWSSLGVQTPHPAVETEAEEQDISAAKIHIESQAISQKSDYSTSD
jgi:hypothetical protein